MKKISIAFLAAMSIASFGCKKKGGGGDALAKMTEFKDKMCACKDKGCADKVNDEMMKWGQEQAKNAGEKSAATDGEEAKKIAAVSEEFSKCLTKVATADMGGAAAGGSAAPAAPAAGGDGSAAPAAGGAAPAAGSADGSAAAPAAAGSAAPAGGSDGSAK